MNLIAFLGSMLLALCAVPELLRTLYDNKCYLSWAFLLLWFLGEILMLIYSIHLWNYALMMNYIFNTIVVTIMLYIKIKNEFYDRRS
jgi:hypothetical protein